MLDLKNLNYIKKVHLNKKEGWVTGICVCESKQWVYVVDFPNSCLYLLNKEYQIVKQNNLEPEKTLMPLKLFRERGQRRFYSGMDYNIVNEMLYVTANSVNERKSWLMVIEGESLIVINEKIIKDDGWAVSLKLFNNKIYVCKNMELGSSNIQVFDLNLLFITSFGSGILDSPYDIILSQKSNYYFYISDKAKKCLHVFSTDNNYDYLKHITVNGYPGRGVFVNNILYILNKEEKLRTDASKTIHFYSVTY